MTPLCQECVAVLNAPRTLHGHKMDFTLWPLDGHNER